MPYLDWAEGQRRDIERASLPRSIHKMKIQCAGCKKSFEPGRSWTQHKNKCKAFKEHLARSDDLFRQSYLERQEEKRLEQRHEQENIGLAIEFRDTVEEEERERAVQRVAWRQMEENRVHEEVSICILLLYIYPSNTLVLF